MYTAKGTTNNTDQMLKQHSVMVKRMAYQLKSKLPSCVEVDDLVQAGMIGLMDAIQRYEDTHGAQFETYASQRVRGAMLDELRGADWLPRGIRKNMRDIEVAVQQLEQRFGRPPTESEIAKHMNFSLEDYYDVLSDCQGHQLIYYEDFQDDDSSEHFLDRYVDDDSSDPVKSLLESDFREALIDSIDRLPEREKVLMGLYYEQELNLKEIGAIMNVSESRVCQLHSQAVARLRASMRDKAWTGAA
ncbi:RNA polymerase, sigma 28 subunit, SigD/FliA/WhiG [Methylophilus rhizosphaerae]|uniref:RNA polymerase sigma factor FliA n=1 Tax=Methylophilus rhizosphaerae TaxID=492660 RepID=A0A1G9AUR0_9PROT|nr:RNA polymerase sigma factor FliA [Methylophilus rhizosphaerae]SDK30335.1 RNA polymerase, sigma 28 subunit, SigD/FliA/WhiG [Methylophilus rhizosphaerae]